MDEQQLQKIKAIDDQQAEGVGGKRPYRTPKLTKLGTVQQLTEGMPLIALADDNVLSGG
ncbi:MAG: hypothetical protein HZA21_03705 [Nitrospirae bacterium]|nr:hypothetical protein [Nitrospirota bacterium]